jgi:hypothetical protein
MTLELVKRELSHMSVPLSHLTFPLKKPRSSYRFMTKLTQLTWTIDLEMFEGNLGVESTLKKPPECILF